MKGAADRKESYKDHKDMYRTLRLILGDQLNYKHSWFDEVDDNVTYCMFEMRQETDYVKHHIQKIAGFFQSMRCFSDHLKSNGHSLIYYKINDKNNTHNLKTNIDQVLSKGNYECFEYILPDEYRLDQQLVEMSKSLSIQSRSFDSEHFLCSRSDFKEFFEGKKTYLMENFYRHMRKTYGFLMEGDSPVGKKWNYDQENREALNDDSSIEKLNFPVSNVEDLLKEIEDSGAEYFGEINGSEFIWPTDRKSALNCLEVFLDKGLKLFGTYQDAMHTDHEFLYHSRLSFALNTKMLSPKEVVEAAIDKWTESSDISIAQIEGFIRQIIGWREYMRGVYWSEMPQFDKLNFFGNTRSLPIWYWTGETKMNCLSHCIKQSLNQAYAHHIQRLMITGNFALLVGVDPDEVDEWYLGIYIDAIQWVEITNTRGMSQYADGGIVGTKPYVSSASYINKMSNYCKNCYYSASKKFGAKSCPFNSMYWHFYVSNRDKLSNNPRVAMMYRIWDKMDNEKQNSYLNQAEIYLDKINEL